MKYTKKILETIYKDVEIEVLDGTHYFYSLNEDKEPEYYYRISIQKDLRFNTLYDISITQLCNYKGDFFISWWEVNDHSLPYNISEYFSGEKYKQEITKTEFNKIQDEVMTKINNTHAW